MAQNESSGISDFDETVVATNEPVSAGERNHAIDMLRGVAVAGILFMNIYAFAMPFSAYANPTALGGIDAVNLATWYVTYIFFDQKFLAIFSMLFGGGLVMMMQRADARGIPYAATWYRRAFWLTVLGLLHGYFLWVGDILFSYGLLGMIIFLFRDRSPRALVLTAIVVMSIAPLFAFSGGVYIDKLGAAVADIEQSTAAGETVTDERQALLDEWQRVSVWVGNPDEKALEELAAYRKGYIDIFEFRAPTYWTLQTDAFIGWAAWRVGGMMLLGMALMKLGILSGERSPGYYRRLAMTGYVLGFPIVIFGAWNLQQHNWDHVWAFSVGNVPNYVGSVLVALGHIGVVMYVVNTGMLNGLMQRFAAVGRMAFTNYLMHSVILTTVFYGYGFGLYGEVDRVGQMGFVIAVIMLQLWYSPLWLRYFRFGPAEWLWRSLTYWKIQPMKKLRI